MTDFSGAKALRLAIDIGGTFTDTVLLEGEDTILASTKTLTSHANPADGAMEGARRVASMMLLVSDNWLYPWHDTSNQCAD